MIVLLVFRQMTLFALVGVSDFTGFVVGSELLGTPQLYDVSANLGVQNALTGRTAGYVIYNRPPFWAALLKPFSFIPHILALVLWKLLMIGALVGFVRRWPLVPTRFTALAVCCSLPAGIAISRANDAPLILLLVALSVVFWQRGHGLLAGMMLGLCLAKFHFFVFLPLVLFRRRHWRPLAGFAAVAAVIVAVNFLVQPGWPLQYWKALQLPLQTINVNPALEPNFYASFFWTGHAAVGVALGVLIVGALLWPACRTTPFEIAVPLCLLGGVLAAPHTNDLDAILAIPALLAVARFYPHLRLTACLLLSPLAAFLYCVGPQSWGPALFVTTSVWLLYRVARGASSMRTEAREVAA